MLVDVAVVLLASLDVLLSPVEKAATYSNVLSCVACVALIGRRRFPFLTTLCTVPGYLAGWSQLAGLFALATLARRRLWTWPTMVGASGVWLARFVRWPIHRFWHVDWRGHALDAIYAFVYAGAPIGLALLAAARQELSARIQELAASREREKRLHTQAMLAEERARLARELHDVVSHQVTLIAMQSGALQVTTQDVEAREVAATIRLLSTRTLEELRQLVGVFRSPATEVSGQRRLDDIADLVRTSPMDVTLSAVLPSQTRPVPAAVATAAYRTVQEGLTNVYKHAGDVRTTVGITVVDGALVLEIRNAAPDGGRRPELPSGGHGLTGLRERAVLLGGSFHAGPCSDGGFLLRSTFHLGSPGAEAHGPS